MAGEDLECLWNCVSSVGVTWQKGRRLDLVKEKEIYHDRSHTLFKGLQILLCRQ